MSRPGSRRPRSPGAPGASALSTPPATPTLTTPALAPASLTGAYAPDLAATPGRVQTRLQQRRPVAIRRHAARTIRRLALLIATDLAAATLACALLRRLTSVAARPLPTLAGALAGALAPAPELIGFAVFLALLLTGNYYRRARAQAEVNVVQGTVLAALFLDWPVATTRGFAAAVLAFPLLLAALGGALVALRVVARAVAARLSPSERWAAPAVVVGARGRGRIPGQDELPLLDRDYRVVGHVATGSWAGDGAIGTLADLGDIVDRHQVEAVIVPTRLPDAELAYVVDVCESAGCECLYSIRAMRVAGNRTRLVWRGEEPFFEFGTPVLRAQEQMWKRCADVVVASLVLLAVLPLLLLVALAIRLDSPGPVLFAQRRAGLGGRPFRMLKLRTMHVGADAEKATLAHLNRSGDARLFKIPDDPRTTRVGRFLRRWSLDELPQLLNVLRGEMSLVGPRPFFETDLEDYEAHHFRRLGAKPGITGLWQVTGRSSVVDFEEVVRLDRQYIEEWSFWLELRILLLTVPAVLRRRGAF